MQTLQFISPELFACWYTCDAGQKKTGKGSVKESTTRQHNLFLMIIENNQADIRINGSEPSEPV